MDERTQEALSVHFDARVRLEFHGATLTSKAGCWHVASWTMPWD
jgi:hypothetical protein